MSKSTFDLLLGLGQGKLSRPSKEVELKRLSEIAGEPVIFKCQALTMDEFEEIQEISMSVSKKGELESFSASQVQLFTLLKGIVEPDLKDARLLEAYGVSTPKQLLESSKLLLPGEITQLYNIISSLSGFGEGSLEELKNE
ncbi:phage tail assembly chaperone [Paenibacillus arenosi]|uniref:XkdN-like protein n=1 Tax=Paenibacillus arenosi TaxID=2774142 RepID=A0ABR9B3K2_9BACL|nr:XkdN-like protein [Paenibacillus arenosi]MBD8500741.1 XkdN-like protein [Paenibacillus arenosi]